MLTLKGIPTNIVKPLLGRISFCSVPKNERSTTIVTNLNISRRELKNYVALISANSNIESQLKFSTMPSVYNIESIDSLAKGDIVDTILPNGLINVLYKINSIHNQLFVTSRCNCKCIMCPQPINYNEENLKDLNLKLISLIDKSTEELALNGGEPTIIGHDLFRLILACKKLLPNTSLQLLTNARKFSNFEYTHLFCSLRHPKLTVSTSIYGDNNADHDFIVGSKGTFNETIMGVLNLASFDIPIEIRTVIHKYTYMRLKRISEFIYRNMTFTRHIAFMGLETICNAKENLDLLWVEPGEVISPLEQAIHYLVQRGMNVSIYNIPLCLLPENLWVFARQSISEWKNSFDPKCHMCSLKKQCSGMFDSGTNIYKKYLKPVC